MELAVGDTFVGFDNASSYTVSKIDGVDVEYHFMGAFTGNFEKCPIDRLLFSVRIGALIRVHAVEPDLIGVV